MWELALEARKVGRRVGEGSAGKGKGPPEAFSLTAESSQRPHICWQNKISYTHVAKAGWHEFLLLDSGNASLLWRRVWCVLWETQEHAGPISLRMHLQKKLGNMYVKTRGSEQWQSVYLVCTRPRILFSALCRKVKQTMHVHIWKYIDKFIKLLFLNCHREKWEDLII